MRLPSKLSIFACIVLLCSPVCAAEPVGIGKLMLSLPTDYEDQRGRGIDSTVGEIIVKDKPFRIHYDDFQWGRGPKNLGDYGKDILERITYYQVFRDAGLPIGIFAWTHPNYPQQVILTVMVLDQGATLDMDLPPNIRLEDAVAVLRTIKFELRKLPASR